MEVHHHSHTSRKKWTHYFWEFLMLFLAVFCGFLAEYMLEHKIEKKREYQYMQGLIDDLAGDTVELNSKIRYTNVLSNGLDSLLDNLYDTDDVLRNTQTIYRQNYTHIRILTVNFNDHTSTQLRHSGSLRLVKSRATAHDITEYWNWITNFQGLTEILEQRASEIFTAGSHIFNSKYWFSSVTDTVSGMRWAIIDPGARLMTTDSNTLISYANYIHRFNLAIDNFFMPRLIAQKNRAIKLINTIKKEYRLS